MTIVNRTPYERVIKEIDQNTGKPLVKLNKHSNRWQANQQIPVVREGEEELVENYSLAKADNFKGWHLHHRLELTLDGDFANSSIDLVNKGMYFYRPYFELIWLRKADHIGLHSKARTGAFNSMFSRKHDELARKKMSTTRLTTEGRGREAKAWKGDAAKLQAKILRLRKAYQRGELSLEEYRSGCKEINKLKSKKGIHRMSEEERRIHSEKLKEVWRLRKLKQQESK